MARHKNQPQSFPLEESSQLWKQRAHHLCNDPSRCDAASDCDGIRVISVIGPNDDPPRWALQSGSWGEPSAPAHTEQWTGTPERMPLSPSKRNGSTQSDHFKIHLLSRCDFRQNATYGFFLICHPFSFIGTILYHQLSQPHSAPSSRMNSLQYIIVQCTYNICTCVPAISGTT